MEFGTPEAHAAQKRFARHFRAVLISVALAILGYFALAVMQDGGQAWQAAKRLGAGGMALVLALSLANYAVRYWRWQVYLRALGFAVPGNLALRYYVAGFGFTTTPGKIGEAVRSWYLRRHDVPYTDSLSLFVTERLSDMAAMLLLSALALAQFPRLLVPVLAVLLVCTGLFAAIRHEQARRVLGRLPERLRGKRLRQLGEKTIGLLSSAARLMEARLLVLGLLLGLVAWGAEGIAFHYILRFLGIELPFWLSIGIYSVSVLIGAVSFLPGGLGSTEASMALLLLLAGAGHGEAVAATIICRVATLWFAVVLGALAMLSIGQAAPANAPGR